MSHFFAVVLVENETQDILSRVRELMAPYDETMKAPPRKKYMDRVEVEAMADYYEIDPVHEAALAGKMDRWKGCEGRADDTGLYYFFTHNPKSKWDYWAVGGRWNGAITGKRRGDGRGGFNFGDQFRRLGENMVPVRDLPENFLCFAVVTPEGEWIDRGRAWPEDKDLDGWKAELKRIFECHSDCVAVGVDCHV
ncbi:MAG: hypothetical protein HY548_09340 [Elusimicrobia bacterium]|nr:hypothetical protein [Elusimicrobiota bacterium]